MSTAPPPGPPPQDPPAGAGGPGPWGPPPGQSGWGAPGGPSGPGWGAPGSWQPPPPPPRRSRTGLYVGIAVVVVLALVLAAALGTRTLLARGEQSEAGPASQAPSPPEPTGSLPAAPDGLEAFYDQELDWSDCAGGECATLTAPLDYAEPDGETIDVAVIRVPARDRENRIGQLVLNPGGPGASGIDYARAGALATGPDIARVYDLVGFDPRGVGSSTAVTCGPTELLDAYIAADPDPESDAEEAEVDAVGKRFADSCARESGALLEHVSTAEAARDMDVLRAALGEPELDYLGTSYGTTLGATYAELFPTNVGRMVLDAAVTPDPDPVANARDQLGGFQIALTAYLESCVEQGDCPVGDSVDDAEQGIADLLDELDAEPLPTADGRDLTEGRAVYGMFLPLYVPSLWPTLTQALTAAQQGDGSALGILSDQYVSRGPDGYQGNLYEALPAVNCLDVDPDAPEPDLADYRDEFEQISPAFGSIFSAGSGCEDWPAKPTQAPPTIEAEGAAPIVVVGTTRDPATPYKWAQALADALVSGVLVSRDGDGHAGFQQGNACVDDAVNGFMIDGTVPDDGLRC
ncbi:alpha/beta hydrolase [Nocardioides marmoraquaticus]